MDVAAGIFALILLLALPVIGLGAGVYAYRRIKGKIGDLANAPLQTTMIMKGLQDAAQEIECAPKSVSAATSLFLPRILKDFPDLHYEEMKRRAENVLVSYLRSVDRLDASLLTEGTSELRNKLKLRIEMLQAAGKEEHFQDIKIHQTEICAYRKIKGRCSIVFQSAVQYGYWATADGQAGEGSRDRLRQSRYDVELIYIQDRELAENMEDSGLAMNCPNCGAPLPKLGAKKCAYCDSPIVEFNIRTWNFSDVREKT